MVCEMSREILPHHPSIHHHIHIHAVPGFLLRLFPAPALLLLFVLLPNTKAKAHIIIFPLPPSLSTSPSSKAISISPIPRKKIIIVHFYRFLIALASRGTSTR